MRFAISNKYTHNNGVKETGMQGHVPRGRNQATTNKTP